MKLITRNLVNELQELNEEAEHICWITAFAMASGVKLMLPSLKEAHERGATIQLLAGDYLSITQPDALEMLCEALPNAEIRLYQTNGQSFHPKAYLYRHKEAQHVIVGSSNLSKSALTTGIEWSLHTVDEETYEQATEEFLKVFYGANTVKVNALSIARYQKAYEAANQQMPIAHQWEEAEAESLMYGASDSSEVIFDPPPVVLEPRPAQQMALEALQDTLEQGYDKAMAVLATGLGKTYLAAFFAQNFKRVLFVAHRDEILEQAKKAFSHVHLNRTSGYYNSVEKRLDADMTFASIYTLSRPHHLEKFAADAFDFIVIDEFHHAAAPTYHRLLNHFKPKFLLGITATPDRLDNKDVYAICDGNVAIEIHFIEAIAHQWLSPFHYYGVKDEIDYTQIRWVGTHYDEQQLVDQQLQETVLEHVFQRWIELKQTRTIGFCSSVKQANYMAHYFRQQGVRALSLTGQNLREERLQARQELDAGTVDIIFTVDLFNEGVDIPKVDTLLFIRPTESIAIFTQQVGRGLRLADGKEKCVIIDFIGNYRNADRKLKMLNPTMTNKADLQAIQSIPETDIVLNLDLEVIDLLQEMIRKNQSYKQKIIAAFEEVKVELGRRPTYLELYLQSGYEDLNVAKEFKTYVQLLKDAGDLSTDELAAFEHTKELLIEIEKTAMTKSYKMVLLHVMLERGVRDWYKPITAKETAPEFATYLSQPTKRAIDNIDLKPQKVESLLQRMPMTKWAASSKELADFDDTTFQFNIAIDPAYEEIIYGWVKEICEFRLHRYFSRKAEKLG